MIVIYRYFSDDVDEKINFMLNRYVKNNIICAIPILLENQMSFLTDILRYNELYPGGTMVEHSSHNCKFKGLTPDSKKIERK